MAFWEYVVFVKNYLLHGVVPRFLDMVFVTIQKKETLEILIPLMITLFLVQIYFGRNRDETIGWNTAYANCIVLLFVTAHLGTYVYEKYGLNALNGIGTEAYYKTLFVVILGLVALSLMFIDFFHSLDERISFLMSSSVFINVVSFVGVVLVYSDIEFDLLTFFTSIFILFVVSLFFRFVRSLVPPSESAEKYLLEKEKKHLEQVEQVKHDIVIKRNRFRRKFRWIVEVDKKITNKFKRIRSRNRDFWHYLFGEKNGF